MLRMWGGLKASLSISPATRRYQIPTKLRTVSMFAKGFIYLLLSCSLLTFNLGERFENVLLTSRDVESSKKQDFMKYVLQLGDLLDIASAGIPVLR